jgi:hypothetical protein
MPSSHIKRAERAIQTIRDQAELPPKTADALRELVDVVRYIDGRLSTLESKGKPHSTEAMAERYQTGNDNELKKRPQRWGYEAPRPSKFPCRDNEQPARLTKTPTLQSFRIARDRKSPEFHIFVRSNPG